MPACDDLPSYSHDFTHEPDVLLDRQIGQSLAVIDGARAHRPGIGDDADRKPAGCAIIGDRAAQGTNIDAQFRIRRDASILNALNLVYAIYFITPVGFVGPIVPVRK